MDDFLIGRRSHRGPIRDSQYRGSFLSSPSGAVRDFLILVGATVLLTLPVLIYGPMSDGHDALEHRLFTQYFTEQFWAGDLYPRWLMNMNHGLGSATFFVYPPLPAYVVAVLTPFARPLHLDSLRIMGFLAMLVSGLAAYLWLRATVSRKVALVSAILYMLAPYHLTADFYRRAAWPECWALAWMPLILYFTSEISKSPNLNTKIERRTFVALGAVYALMILSHLISVAIFSLIPPALAIILSSEGSKLRSLKLICAGLFLGVCLSGFYFFSALFEFARSPASRFTSRYPFLLTDNLIPLNFLSLGGSNFAHSIALIVPDTLALIVLCAIAVLCKRQLSPATKNLVIFWVALSTVIAFLMTTPSIHFWEWLPAVHNILQFPWRLNIVLCLATGATAAIFLSEMSAKLSWRNTTALSIFVLIVATWVGSYTLIWRRYLTEGSPDASLTMADGWFPGWSAPGTDWPSALVASTGPQAQFLGSAGSAQIISWRPRHIEVRTSSTTGGTLSIHQFYYPSWQAHLTGSQPLLDLRPSMPQGLLELTVPSGIQNVKIDLPVGPSEWMGLTITALSVLFCIVFLWSSSPSAPYAEGPLGHVTDPQQNLGRYAAARGDDRTMNTSGDE